MNKDIIVLEYFDKGELQITQEIPRQVFNSGKSGVLTLLDLDPDSVVIIDKPKTETILKYYFKKD